MRHNKILWFKVLILVFLFASPFITKELGKAYGRYVYAQEADDKEMEKEIKKFDEDFEMISNKIKQGLDKDQADYLDQIARAEFQRQHPPSQDEVINQWLEDIKLYNQ